MKGRILAIAGSDSGGGAGIQADIKTITALGGYAMTAITALTAQNTMGVFGVHPVPPAFVAQQMAVVLDDLGADALKTGMLQDSAIINAVADMIEAKARGLPLVVDPVMVAKGGADLLQKQALAALRARLFPLAALVTPNIPEAEILSGVSIQNDEDMRRAGRTILSLGAHAVLLKGGHGAGDIVTDILIMAGMEKSFSHARLVTTSTHGTGCTLASAIAVGLGQGLTLEASINCARDYVWRAIQAAPGYGQGHGPLNHSAGA